jgi:hypothetical protein
LHSFICRTEFARAAAQRRNRCRVLLGMGRWEARRWNRRWCGGLGCAARRLVGRVRARTVQAIVGKNVCNWREAVVGLCCWNVVDVACLAQSTGTMLRMAGVWLSRAETCECLMQGSRLNNSVMCELLGRRCVDR